MGEAEGEIMKEYCRKSHFAKLGKDDFITPNYGEAQTGYDFAEAAKDWLLTQGLPALSVVEVHLKRKRRGVGMARIFLSHVQREPLAKTLLRGDSREAALP